MVEVHYSKEMKCQAILLQRQGWDICKCSPHSIRDEINLSKSMYLKQQYFIPVVTRNMGLEKLLLSLHTVTSNNTSKTRINNTNTILDDIP